MFEAARAEGYEAGETEIEQERMRLQREYAEKTKELEAAFEKKKRDLEPQAVDVVVDLLQSLTGVLLQERKGIVTYLITKALSDTERSGAFLIRVSKEDYEEVKNNADAFRNMFEREVTLEVVQDIFLQKGECIIETDSSVIDCSLGTQLEGLIEDIRLLSVRERA